MIAYKVATIGAAGSGKTSIINSYIGLPLSDEVTVMANYRAIPVSFQKNDIEKKIKLYITDTAGQEKYNSAMPSSHFRGAHAGLIVFDLSDEESLTGIDKRIYSFLDYARSEAVLFIVGNKSDITLHSELAEKALNRRIRDIMNQHIVTAYVKTSALTGKNVNLLFEQLANVLDSVFPVDSFYVVAPLPNEQPTYLQRIYNATHSTLSSCFY